MSKYKLIAEAIAFDGLKTAKMPKMSSAKKMSIEEIKEVIQEEMKKASDVAKVKAKELKNGWNDAEIENYLDWMKQLKLEEVLSKKNK